MINLITIYLLLLLKKSNDIGLQSYTNIITTNKYGQWLANINKWDLFSRGV